MTTRAWSIVGLAGMIGFGSVATTTFLMREAPEPRGLWILGPPAEDLRVRSERALGELLDTLNAPGSVLDVAHVLDDYQAVSHTLRDALRRSPLEYRAATMLAALDWEVTALGGRSTVPDRVALIEHASSIAPRDPFVRFTHGKLLLLIGHQEAAIEQLKAGARLSTETSIRSAMVLIDAGVDPETVRDSFPGNPHVLIGIARSLAASGDRVRFIELARDSLADPPAALVSAFGEACLGAGRHQLLRDTLAALAPPIDVDARAEIFLQTARAELYLGNLQAAHAAAEKVADLRGDSIKHCEALGTLFAQAADYDRADTYYRRALRIAAETNSPAHVMARLYRQVGDSSNRAGRMDEAIDAYRHAAAFKTRDAPERPGPDGSP